MIENQSKHTVLSKINEVVVDFVRTQGWLLISNTFEGELNRDGGLSGVGLIGLAKMVVSVFFKKKTRMQSG